MKIKEINAKSILRKYKTIDSWFISKYGMNLYRGCNHNCIYCDGRSEKYRVLGLFGSDIEVKTNALEILSSELKKGKEFKVPFNKGFIMIGGGVGDSYQPAEEKYEITRKTLKLLNKHNLPVHILTKSNLINRDFDILKEINENTKAIISMSFSSVEENISKIFEPNVPSPKERLQTLLKFKKEGFLTGMFLLPVIPYISDNPRFIEESIKNAKEIGLDYVIFGGMTLKSGKQKDYFYKILKKEYPDLITNYENIYKNDKWGNPSKEYYHSINNTFSFISRKYRINKRIPVYLCKDFLDINKKIILILQHIDYLLKLKGMKSPYGYASYSLSKLDKPIPSMKFNLRKIQGVGKVTEKIIWEIIDTGSCKYYEKLLIS